ncbi:DUF3857 domain-containing protein [Pseudoxanthomonas winnipegensis]|uniref:DUF3857 domain-containing protein n=2 Tax=Pseudoxanthomonas winnipegensis TaxID=2480810 RepID=A0A4Q8M171_9GAMM|nr:DUF3857 domain-containing protein [Pseudoxanthomonas winnipegensis]
MIGKVWFGMALWLAVAAAAGAIDRPDMAATPAWVADEPTETGHPAPAVGNLRYEVVSDQVDPTGAKPVWYRHIGFTVLREQGLTDGGNFSVDYQPEYQRLVLSEIEVLRDGRRIDMRDRASYARLRREQQLDSGLLDGRVTLNVTVPDLRVGDRLDYSFMVIGQNPIFGSAYYDDFGARYNVPVGWRRVRVRYPQIQPVFAQVSVPGFATSKTGAGGVETLDITARNLPSVIEPEQTPAGYDSLGIIRLSTARSWADIVAWAAPLYPRSFRDPAVAAAMASQLKLDSAQPEASLQRAVAFVQGQIRYTGLDMGVNSHAPHAPEATLADRFGDCKDKTTLLVALLGLAGVRAEPVLVNTQPGKELREAQPSANLFDHVVVRAHLPGGEVWIDATRDREFGPLNERLALPYRVGLPLVAGGGALVDIPYPLPAKPQIEVSERVQVRSTDDGYEATFDLSTRYRQGEGESVASGYRRNGDQATGERYLRYMQDFYEGLSALGKPVMQEPGEGMVDMHERYRLMWKRVDGTVLDLWLFQLNDWMTKLPNQARSTPYALGGPRFAVQTMEVQAGNGFDIPDAREVVENPWFRFVRSTRVEGKTLHITGEWTRLAKQIPASGMERAARDMAQARDLLVFPLELESRQSLWGSWRDWRWPFAGLLLAGLLVLACYPFRRGSLPMSVLFAPRHAALAVPARPWSMACAWLAYFGLTYFDMAADKLVPGTKLPIQAVALVLIFAAVIGGWLRAAISAGLLRMALGWLRCKAATFDGICQALVVATFSALPFSLGALVALQGHITWLNSEAELDSARFPGLMSAGLLMLCGCGWGMVSAINAVAASAATSRRRALAGMAIAAGIVLLLIGVVVGIVRLAR